MKWLLAALLLLPIAANAQINLGPPVAFDSGLIANNTTQATATLIRSRISIFGTVASSGSAVLPASGSAGVLLTVMNHGANTLSVYPIKGGQIDSLGVDQPFSVPSGGTAQFQNLDTGLSPGLTWSSSGTVSSGSIIGSLGYTPLSTTGDAGATTTTATGGTVAQTLADFMGNVIWAKSRGVKCDNSHDDGPAIQAINDSSSGINGPLVILPYGVCKTSGVTITKPIMFQGQGQWGTRISLIAGTTVPAFTISIPTANFSAAVAAKVRFSDLQLTSPSNADVPGQGVAHGISLVNAGSPAETVIYLEDVLIYNTPGDCIHSQSFTGSISGIIVACAYPGGYGLYANSSTDFNFISSGFYGAVNDNIFLSGTTNFRFTNLNLFVAQGNDMNIFNSDVSCVNCMIDETGTNGLLLNNTNGKRADFVGSTFRWASTRTNATYSAIHMNATNTGNVYLTGVTFPTPASSPSSNKALNNIQFDSGNTGLAITDNTSFDLGAVTTAGVTNQTTSIQGQSVGDFSVGRNLFISGNVSRQTTATQFGGYDLKNGSNEVATIQGTTSANDSGTLQLYNAGVVVARISAGNGLSNLLNSPSGTVIGGGPLSVGAGYFDTSYEYSQPSTGGTVTYGTNKMTEIIDPAGSLATLTIQLPGCASTADGKTTRFSTTQAIASLTLTTSSGVGTIADAPNSLAIGGANTYICRGSTGVWYRIGN